MKQNSHHASMTNQHGTKDRLNLNNREGTRQGGLTRHRRYQSGKQTGKRLGTGEGKNQEVAEGRWGRGLRTKTGNTWPDKTNTTSRSEERRVGRECRSR